MCAKQNRRRLQRALERFESRCFYCKQEVVVLNTKDRKVRRAKFPDNAATVDHVIPRSRGGSKRLENEVLSCFGCNRDKQDMDVSIFLAKKLSTDTKAAAKGAE